MKLSQLMKYGAVAGVALTLGACGTYKHGHASKDVVSGETVAEIPAQARTQIISSAYYFEFDNSQLSDDAKAELDRFALLLEDNPNAKIRVEGHTDSRGRASYNVALGERRAQSVASYLTEKGVPTDNIEVFSFGSENPVDLDGSELAFAKNRRAEIFFDISPESVA